MTSDTLQVTITIRPANAADGQPVRRLVFDILNEYRVPADPDDSDQDVMSFGEDLNPRTLYFVAESQGVILGCVIVTPTDRESGKLSKLFVDPRYRRRGIGRKLMDQAVRTAAGHGYVRLVIHTRARYREAISFYESSGWQRGPDIPGPGPDRSYSFALRQTDERAPFEG